MEVSLDPQPPWLRYKGKWGSTVVAPALQEWCVTGMPSILNAVFMACSPMALAKAQLWRTEKGYG